MISLGFLLFASLGAQAPGPSAEATSSAAEVVVSLNRGRDTQPGTQAEPVRTVTRGVALAREAGATLVRVEFGEYAEGESFPIELPPGVELRGIGQGGTVLRGDSEAVLRLAPSDAPATTILAGLTLAGARVGLDAATHPFTESVGMPGGAPVEVLLRGVGFLECGLGVQARAEAGPLALRGSGVRAERCTTGLEFEGFGELTLQLSDSSFEGCGVGLLLRAAEGQELVGYAGPPVQHNLALTRCAFVGCATGFERRGAAGENAGPAYRVTDCVFRGNETGLYLKRPSADTPLMVRGTRFHGNSGMGLRIAGHRGDPGKRSLIADSDFRWNGVGLHAANTHIEYHVERSRFVDNVGNALFVSNFQTEPVKARIVNSLFAGNGGAGIYTMADGERLACDIVHCTVVENGAAGVHRKTRHSGESELSIRGSILWGNSPDLERVEPDEVATSLVGDGTAGTERANLAGAPGFMNAALRDYRLVPESPCVDAGLVDAGLEGVDLNRAARLDAPDLGALELVR